MVEEFYVRAYYPGHLWPDYDKRLAKAAKQSPGGGGIGMGERDLEWTRKTRLGAESLAKRLKKIKYVTVELDAPEETIYDF